MTQEEQSKIAKINAAADKFITAKGEIKAKLNEYGVVVTDNTPFADYPDKVEELGKKTIPATNEAVVTVYLNPTGSDYWLPEGQAEREALLHDAMVSLKVEGEEFPFEKQITKLENEVITLHFTLPGSEIGTIYFKFGTKTALVAKQTVHVKGGTTATLTCTTYKNAVEKRFAFGRAQFFDGTEANEDSSWTILREYAQDGSYIDRFGFIDDSINGETGLPKNEWVSQTGIKLAIYNGGDVADGTKTIVPIENCDDPNAVALENKFKCLRDIRIVDVNCGVMQKFVRFPKCYTKRETTTLEIPHKENGVVTKTDTKKVVILWIADEQIDETFHLHGAFVRTVRGGADVELNEMFISRYKVNSAYNSVPGVDALGTTRANYAANIKAKNGTALTYTDEYGVAHTFAANADTRRWAMIGYREQSLLTLYAFLYFGSNSQEGLNGRNGLMGITTAAAPDPGQPKTGCTDHLVANGIMNGGSLNTDPRKPTIFCYIENPFSSSEGTMMADVTSVAYRGGEGHTVPVNCLIIAHDRADYNPGSDAYDTLLANGYHELQCEYLDEIPEEWDSSKTYQKGEYVTHLGSQYRAVAVNTNKPPKNASNNLDNANWCPLRTYLAANNRMANFTAPIERDMFFPTSCKAEENITAKNYDNHWSNSVPAVGTETKNWKMVALGYGRNIGSSLGAFSLNAGSALAYSSGAGWRSRSSLQLV